MNTEKQGLLTKLFVQVSFLIFSFIYLSSFFSATLSVMEQMQLFIFDKYFLFEHLNKPGGTLMYLGKFFTQFFFHPWLGAIIISLLSGGIQYFITSIYRIPGKLYFLSFIPSALLLFMQTNPEYLLASTLVFFILLLFLFICTKMPSDRARWYGYLIAQTAFYYIAGGYIIIFTLLVLLHELFYQKGGVRFHFMIALLATMLLVPYISSKFVYTYINIWGSYFEPLPPFLQIEKIELVSYILIFLFFLGIPLVRLGKNAAITVITGTLNLLAVALLSGTVVLLTKNNRNSEKLFQMTKAVQQENWTEVIEIGKKIESPGQMISIYLNMALCKEGLLGHQMFLYDQRWHEKGMYIPFQKNPLAIMMSSEIYYQLGLVNYSYRCLMEGMVLSGQSSRFLVRLAQIAVINKEYALAQKYLNTLKQTLFYKKWATDLEKHLMAPGPGYNEKRDLLPNQDYLIGENFEFEAFLAFFLKDNPKNRFAYDYFMGYCLLRKNLPAFAKYLPGITNFGNPQLPVHYQEALLVYAMQTGDKSLGSFKVSQETGHRFEEFNRIFYSSSDPATAKQLLSQQFKDTYWYYFLFINNPNAR